MGTTNVRLSVNMDTPESIREAYAAAENESPEQRRKRLASKRAAKYRYFSKVDGERREQHKERQRKWRETLDDGKRLAIREQNRLRQQARRDKMTADDKHRRNQQQRHRRAAMDDHELLQLRERERLRMRRRREQQASPTPESTPPPQPQLPTATHREPMGAKRRLSTSPLMMGAFVGPIPPATAVLPPAAALGTSSSILRADGAIPDQMPAALRHQPQPQHPHHHPPIGIAPLQFVLPPASSIQSLTFADRMAPLPQVQNVLPHASTLLHAASGPSGGSQLQVSASMQLPSSSTMTTSASGMSNGTGGNTVALWNPPYMLVPSLSSSLGSLLNLPLPSLPPCPTTTSMSSATTTTVMPQIQPPAVLPSLSQLPDLFATTAANARDFFDSASASGGGFFPSIAEFTSDLVTTSRNDQEEDQAELLSMY